MRYPITVGNLRYLTGGHNPPLESTQHKKSVSKALPSANAHRLTVQAIRMYEHHESQNSDGALPKGT